MTRYICLHGHFYQPPRENPWLGEIEIQESAAPWHDWNERISEECYGPNSAARLYDDQGWIRRIVNNYSRISFNFGPTLLSWMERKRPLHYYSVLEADRLGARRFSGHGPAIAQAYNHIIMPLANHRDKVTQVEWGMEDFRRRFQRDPEGMWLPETAVDSETLDIMAERGIRFVILAPRQAASVREGGDAVWTDATGERVDTGQPYFCSLRSGRTIAVFFYHGALAQKVAFGDALNNGGDFARILMEALPGGAALSNFVSVATDGETFGHHHKYGDMALAYCLDTLERSRDASLTIFGEYLEFSPPMDEVRLVEDSSWSCVHGVGRWREDCGCSAHSRPGWNQKWRAPLRRAMDGLRDSADILFEREARGLFADPWGARNRYIEVFFDRSRASPAAFMEREAGRGLSPEEMVKGLRLMELQLNLLMMYTSCGWFFDEISGIETIQVMSYAARALELCGRLFQGEDLRTPFLELLEGAPSNIAEFRNGRRVFDIFVAPAASDLMRAGANHALSTLFDREESGAGGQAETLYSYKILSCSLRRGSSGPHRYVTGYVRIRSEQTLEEKELFSAALYSGGRSAICGVMEKPEPEGENGVRSRIEEALQHGDDKALVSFFGHNTYSLRHLFKDEQRRIMNMIIAEDMDAVVSSLRQTVSDYSELLSLLSDLSMPVPETLKRAAEVVLNDEIRRAFERDSPDIAHIGEKMSEGVRLRVDVDAAYVKHAGVQLLGRLASLLEQSPLDEHVLGDIIALLNLFNGRGWDLDLWRAQNIFARIVASDVDLSPCERQYDALSGLLRIRRAGVKPDFAHRAIRT
ncbi:MAG: DUF3536 domain-containing protein [Synergistota bacterium]|nr:DUF3536 domain-containing protein [Synergistota bacterium]OPZ40607.1 MAG: Glycosyl hydrolase family 57 [Synergistetes bacterium ADurb.BinA166]